jgi:IS30 family transposase
MRNAPKKATQSVSSEAIAVEISRLTVATDVQVYFCDPRSPWQRGSNENTNGLLRQYFPKGTDLSSISQAHLNKIALRLNQRPRKTLGFESPADRLNAVLQ